MALASLLGLQVHVLAGLWQATPLSWYSGIVDGITYALTYIPRAVETAALSALLYTLKPLVLTTPAIMDKGLFFNLATSPNLVYSPFLASSTPFTDANGNQYVMGIIPAFYAKAARLTSMVLVLGFIVSSFMITTGVFNPNWRSSAVSNLKKALVFGALSFFSIYLFEAIIELNSTLVNYFYTPTEYDADLGSLLTSLFQTPGDASAQLASLFGMGVALFALLLVVLELVARLGIIVFLPSLGPLIMLMFSFSFTEKVAHKMFEFFVGAVLLQLGVVICLKFTMQILIAVGQTKALGDIPAWAVLSGCSILMAYLPKLIIPGTQAVSQGASALKQGMAATAAVAAIGVGVTAHALGGAGKLAAGAAQGTRAAGAMSQVARGGEWLARHGSAPLKAGASYMGRAAADAVGVGELPQQIAGQHRASQLDQQDTQRELARQAGRPPEATGKGNVLTKSPDGGIQEVPAYTQTSSYRLGTRLREAASNLRPSNRQAQRAHELEQAALTGTILAATAISLPEQEEALRQAPAAAASVPGQGALATIRRLRTAQEIQPQLESIQAAPTTKGVVAAWEKTNRDIDALNAPEQRKEELRAAAGEQFERVALARRIGYSVDEEGRPTVDLATGRAPLAPEAGRRILELHSRGLESSRPGAMQSAQAAATRRQEVEDGYADTIGRAVRDAVSATPEKSKALAAIEGMPLTSRAAQSGIGREAGSWRALGSFIANSKTLPDSIRMRGLDAASAENAVRIQESVRLEVRSPDVQRPLMEALEAVRASLETSIDAKTAVAKQAAVLQATNEAAALIGQASPKLERKHDLATGTPAAEKASGASR
jgi:hypothetical protein